MSNSIHGITNSSGTTLRKHRHASTQTKGARPIALITNSSLHSTAVVAVDRQRLIEEAAYHRAETRAFAPNHELEDWLAAEAEVDQRMASEGRAY